MDYASFLGELRRGTVPQTALLHGPEPFLLEEALALVTRACFPDPSLISLNRELFDAREAQPETILRALLTAPFVAPVRLVVVKESQALSVKGRDAFLGYAKEPLPGARLLFLASEALAPTHWLVKLPPPAALIRVRAPTGRELVSWLRGRAAATGLTVTEEAALLLIQWVGEDLGALAGEVEKAGLVREPERRTVGVEEVRAVVGEHRVRSIFELTRALEHRALGSALSVLEGLLSSGEEPLGVLGMLTRQVRLTWLAKEWLRAGKSAEEVARLLRRPSQAVEAFLARAESCSPAALARQLSRCWEVERRLKAGGLPRPELAQLVAELCAAE
ncbi:MAG: DNA polymerase III subunit delta [Candidatus Methylomirabilia bacterium]